MNQTVPTPSPSHLLLGEILRPHGVRGEVRVRLLTDYPERIAERGTVMVGRSESDANPARYDVAGFRMHQGYGLLLLKGIADRDAAERLRGRFLLVPLEDAVPLEEGEVYLFQLVGLDVRTEDGVRLGVLQEVIETGANDVYVVASERYGQVLLPAIPDVVQAIDVQAGTVVVRLLDGLLPDVPAPGED